MYMHLRVILKTAQVSLRRHLGCMRRPPRTLIRNPSSVRSKLLRLLNSKGMFLATNIFKLVMFVYSVPILKTCVSPFPGSRAKAVLSIRVSTVAKPCIPTGTMEYFALWRLSSVF